jgi:Mg2+ and Co2+ transporter CorA
MWGMNFERIPLAQSPQGFWWMTVLQLGVGFFLLLALRWRGLL